MGLFDIFSSKKTNNNNSLDVLHGMDLREWNNGYKSDDKGIIKFKIPFNVKLKGIFFMYSFKPKQLVIIKLEKGFG